jgi:hypothetical protein
MIKSLLLLVCFATEPSIQTQSVLVLRTGQAMRVLSYEVSDSMVLIRSLKDEPLSIRKDRIDLERSAELTRQLRGRLEDEQEKLASAVTSPPKKPIKPTKRRAPSERWRAGSLSTMSSGDSGSPSLLDEEPSEPATVQTADTELGLTKNKQDWQAEAKSHSQTVKAAESHADELQEQYRQSRRNAELTGAGWETAFRLERKLERAIQERDRVQSAARAFRERARRENILPGWLR